jgi:hypothetical protein
VLAAQMTTNRPISLLHTQVRFPTYGGLCRTFLSDAKTKKSMEETATVRVVDEADQERCLKRLKKLMAENLAAHMELAKPPLNTRDGLAGVAGVNPKTIQRLLKPDTYPDYAPAVDSLCRLATALGIQTYQLLFTTERQARVSGSEPRTNEKSGFSNRSTKRNTGRREYK